MLNFLKAMRTVKGYNSIWILILVSINVNRVQSGNPDAKRLYDDLLSNYNKLVRPVSNVTEAVTVHLKLKLSQLIAVNLKNQIMTTNLWVEQFWKDYKLQWNPEEYGGVDMLHVPSDHIWRPDIVLYNNADGNFEVTLATKATLFHTGDVEWKPPAIYHSSCEMDVEYFPFDEQTCVMKFGSWTYDGFQVDLRHEDDLREPAAISYKNVDLSPKIDVGIDLTEFYMSVEWDILEVPAVRNVKFYTCCEEPYLDITFNITMRRKTLFYTVNLIIPCMGISFLTILVFYLPSDSGEKVSLSINILLSLTVFFLLLAEIIPPTSLVVPLLGKFVLFTMILDTFSICVTVLVLNIHFRTPETHKMAPWVRKVFIHILPRLLNMRRPHFDKDKHRCEVLKSPYFSFTTEDNFYEADDHSDQTGSGEFLKKQKRNHESSSNVEVKTCNGIEIKHNYGSSTMPMERKNVGISKTPDLTRRHRKEYSHYSQEIPFLEDIPPRPKSVLKLNNFKKFKDASRLDGENFPLNGSCKVHGNSRENLKTEKEHKSRSKPSNICPEILKALDGILYIAEHKKKDEKATKILEDWKYVATVMDRLFLWIFTVAVFVGTAGILLQAPTLYDEREPIDYQMSEIYLNAGRPGAYHGRKNRFTKRE